MKRKRKLFRIFSIITFLIFVITEGSIVSATAVQNFSQSQLKTTDKNFYLNNGEAAPSNIERQVDQEFTINYTINPEDIRVKEVENSNSSYKDIVLVIDTSGSMDYYIWGTKKLDTMKEVACNFIDRFKNDSKVRVGVVQYSSSASSLGNGLVDKNSFESLKSGINKLKAEGATNIGDGLRKAHYMLQNERTDAEKYIVLMTDGVPTAYTAKLNSVEYRTSNWYVNGNIISVDGKKTPFCDISRYTFETGNEKNVNYVSYNGDYTNEDAMKYVAAVGNLFKDKSNMNTYVIGFGHGVNSPELAEISRYVNGKHVKADNNNQINKIYEEIGDKIASSMSSEATFSMDVPNGIEVTNLPQGLEFKNGRITGKVGSINYNIKEDGNNGIGNDYYKADPISFSVGFKGRVLDNSKSYQDYIIGGNNVYVTYTVCDRNYKQCFNDVKIIIKNKAALKSFLNLTQSLSPKVDENKYKIDESFNINYTIDPSQGINKVDYDNLFKRNKEIVLVVDTSGSMEEGLGETVERNYIITKIKVKGRTYEVQEYNPYLNTIKYNGNSYTIEDYKLGNGQPQVRINKVWYNVNGYYKEVNRSKLDSLKSTAQNFISKFNGDSKIKIGIVSYDSVGRQVKGLTDSNNFNSLIVAINSLEAEGGTNIGDGIRKAYGMLNNSVDSDKYIVLMTDGFPTAFTSYSSGLIYSKYDGWSSSLIKGEVINEQDDTTYFESISSYSFKIQNDSKSESYVVNYGADDYNGLSMKYSLETAYNAKKLNINTSVIGFSNGINSNKLKEIASSAGGYYKEASDEDALNNIYNKIAEEIKAPTVKDIKFEMKLPDGLIAEEIKSLTSQNALENFYIEEGGKKVSGTIDNINYNIKKNVNGVEQYVIEDSLKDKLKFTVKLKGVRAGDYVLGDSSNSSVIRYTDIDGSSGVKIFNPELRVKIIDKETPMSITNFGIFTGQSNGSAANSIKTGEVSILNRFSYKLGSTLQIGYSDEREKGNVLEKDVDLKINTTGIKFNGNNNIELYSTEGGKLNLIYSWKNVKDGHIIIPAQKLKKGENYIITQNFVPDVFSGISEAAINNSILINDLISTNNKLKLKILNELPNLD